MTTIFLHNVTDARIERHAMKQPSGNSYYVTKLLGTDTRGHEFDISLFSDEPIALPWVSIQDKPVAYDSVADEIESRR